MNVMVHRRTGQAEQFSDFGVGPTEGVHQHDANTLIRIEPRPTEQLNIKVQPDVIAEIDRAAQRLRATRSAVTRALIRSGLDQLRCVAEQSGQ